MSGGITGANRGTGITVSRSPVPFPPHGTRSRPAGFSVPSDAGIDYADCLSLLRSMRQLDKIWWETFQFVYIRNINS